MPILIDDTHDKAEQEAARDRREKSELTAHKEPRGEFAAVVRDRTAEALQNTMRARICDASNDNRNGAIYMEKATAFAGWKDTTGDYAAKAVAWRTLAGAYFDLRDKNRERAEEANKNLCQFLGTAYVPLTWEE
jgi:hypothetical protein